MTPRPFPNQALLLEPKLADMQRAAAFVKRLAGAALASTGPGEAIAAWGAVARCVPHTQAHVHAWTRTYVYVRTCPCTRTCVAWEARR
jgi:hypothetical protein